MPSLYNGRHFVEQTFKMTTNRLIALTNPDTNEIVNIEEGERLLAMHQAIQIDC